MDRSFVTALQGYSKLIVQYMESVATPTPGGIVR